MGELDIAAKALLRAEPEELLRLAFPHLPVVSATADEVELVALGRRMDKLLRVELDGDADPHHAHMEVEANWATDVPAQTFEYWSLARLAVGHDRLESFVLVLKPGDKQGPPIDHFVVTVRGRQLMIFRFQLLCAWTLSARELLAGPRGLLPLIPFAGDSSPAGVDAALAVLHSVSPTRRRAELLGALVAFAGNVFPDVPWLGKIPREILMESTVYKEILAEGRALGAAEGRALGAAEGRALGAAEGRALATTEAERGIVATLLQGRLGADYRTRLERSDKGSLSALVQLFARPLDTDTLRREVDRLLPPG